MEDKKIKVSLRSSGSVWLVALLVAAVTLILYIPALQNDFVNWDDDGYIYENENIRSFDLKLLKWSFTAFYKSNWHPLTWLSHAIDYAIWGLNPAGHHLSSIMLHGMNTFLLCILIFYLLNNSPPNPPLVKGGVRGDFHLRGAVIAGGVTALLFGIHPVHVESVAWAAERKDVLSAFFVLLSLIFYVKYVVRQELSKQYFYYISSLIFFVLALMSKPMAVTLPVMLVILDIYPFQRLSFRRGIKARKKVIIEKVPFFFFSLVSSILTITAQHAGGAIKSIEAYPLSVRIGVAIKGVCFYLAKMVYPSGLSPLYPHPKSISFLSFEYLFSIMLLVAISVFCIWAWKRGWKIFMAVWVFYVVTLLPVLGIVQVGAQAAADRYTYIPSIGPFLLIGLGISLTWEKTYLKDHAFFLSKKLIILPLILILFLLSVLTVKQIKVWSNSITLWTHELKRYPDNKTAYISRANAYAFSDNYIEALKDLNRVIILNPDSAGAYNNRGNAYYALENNQQAIKDYTRAIELKPEDAKAYNNRGIAYSTVENNQQAIKDFTRAIELKPEDAKVYYYRGKAYGESGNRQQAIKDFSKSIELNPEDAKVYYYRGKAYADLGDSQRAINDLDKAIKYDSNFSEAYNNRANVYTRLGDYQKALKDLDKAIESNPGYARAYNNRATAYITLGNYQKGLEDLSKAVELQPELEGAYVNRCGVYNILADYQQAIKDCSRAIELDPEYAMAYNNRGLAYQTLGRYPEAVRDYDKAINLNPEDYKAHYNRGISYRHMGENQKAIKDLSKVIELSPEYSDAYINRGVSYGELGKFENLIQDFNKVIKLNPNNAAAYYNRGAAYYKLGKEKDAIRDFQKAARLGDKKIQEILKKRGIKW